MKCRFCGFSHGDHHVDCPEQLTGAKRLIATTQWHNGRNDGLVGDPPRPNQSKYYDSGYLSGEKTTEENANGCRW